MPDSPRKKTLIIGLDGATFDIIKPLAKEGKLPTFKKIMEEGSFGELQSTIPAATLPAWPSFMTGVNPGKHGVFDFMGRKGQEYYGKIMTSSDIKAKTIWHILSEAGKKCIAINIPATYPPYKINGLMITGMLTPKDKPFTYPPELKNELPDYTIEIDPYLADRSDTNEFLEELISIAKKRLNATLQLLNTNPWDVAMVVFRITDIIGHKKWHEFNKVQQVYMVMDNILSTLIDTYSSRANFILMSDHGFGELSKAFYVNTFLESIGLLKFKKVLPSEQRTEKIYTLLGKNKKQSGITDTLAKLGITAEKALHVINKLHLTPLVKIVPQNFKSKVPAINYDIDWDNTKAYCSAFFTTETQSININLKGRDPNGSVEQKEYSKIRDFLITKLNELTDPKTAEKVVIKAYKKEEAYTGPYLEEAPDIILLLNKGYKMSNTRHANDIVRHLPDLKGKHEVNGIFMAYGTDIGAVPNIPNLKITDVAPTILFMNDQPISKNMDGQVIRNIFSKQSIFALKDISFSETTLKDSLKNKIKDLKI